MDVYRPKKFNGKLPVIVSIHGGGWVYGNFIHFDPVPNGKNGMHYPKNGGFCMEAQHYPDSMDHPNFPNTILRPGERYIQKTVYRFR